MSDLAELLERVKAATGPDREIDAAVMFDLFAKPVGARDDGGPTGYLYPEDNPSWSFAIRFPGKDREWFTAARQKVDGETLTIWRDDAWVLMNSLRIPPLTASLDAALALVERVLPGWQIAIAGPWVYAAHTPNAGRPIWCAEIARDTEDDGLGYKEVNDLPWSAATPALALVAALLHALIDQGQTAVGSAEPRE